jgi:hypothetical protein
MFHSDTQNMQYTLNSSLFTIFYLPPKCVDFYVAKFIQSLMMDTVSEIFDLCFVSV